MKDKGFLIICILALLSVIMMNYMVELINVIRAGFILNAIVLSMIVYVIEKKKK